MPAMTMHLPGLYFGCHAREQKSTVVPFRHAKKNHYINGLLRGFESERNRPKSRLSFLIYFSVPNDWFAVSART